MKVVETELHSVRAMNHVEVIRNLKSGGDAPAGAVLQTQIRESIGSRTAGVKLRDAKALRAYAGVKADVKQDRR